MWLLEAGSGTGSTLQCLLALEVREATASVVIAELHSPLSWSPALKNTEQQSRDSDWLCGLAGSGCVWIQVHALESEPDFWDARVIWVCVCVFWHVLTVLSDTCNVSPKPITLFSKHLPHFATYTHSSSTQPREVLKENNDPNSTRLPTLAKWRNSSEDKNGI